MTIEMGRRGPKPKQGVRVRPFAIVSEGTAAWLATLGAAEVSRMLEWARPRYNLRREPDQPGAPGGQIVLTPPTPRTPEVAVVTASGDGKQLVARLPEKNEAFREVVKLRHGLEWDGQRWGKPLTADSGSPSDRVAELAAALLRAGFIVAVENAELADMVMRGTWVPQQWRWVKALKSGQLVIRWEKGGDEVWRATQNLAGARWDSDLQGTVISPIRYRDLRDFAEQFGFSIHELAEQRLREAEEAERRRLLVLDVPAPAQPRRKPRAPKTPEEVTVPDDLLADDD